MSKNGLEYLQSTEKRRLDVIGGLVIASALAPVALATGAASAIDSKRVNPLFIQERLGGKGEQYFNTLKFQTLSKNLGSFASNQTFGTFDPRASRLGQFLRQSGLDEVPQVVNVLKGDMSLVGARPLAAVDIERYETVDSKLFDEWYPSLKVAKAGLMGESQIYRHHYRFTTDEMVKKSMEMDLKYFETASLKQDLHWIARAPLNMVVANVGVVENFENPVELQQITA